MNTFAGPTRNPFSHLHSILDVPSELVIRPLPWNFKKEKKLASFHFVFSFYIFTKSALNDPSYLLPS